MSKTELLYQLRWKLSEIEQMMDTAKEISSRDETANLYGSGQLSILKSQRDWLVYMINQIETEGVNNND